MHNAGRQGMHTNEVCEERKRQRARKKGERRMKAGSVHEGEDARHACAGTQCRKMKCMDEMQMIGEERL